ncbi:cysteine hydrolase family protein, partial [Paraburkholderia unamae]|uniref:cysteine hydrolase family protein n=1 Tax=Paraburkholderia unamae TaxID=219649 RepID=UPI001CC59E93
PCSPVLIAKLRSTDREKADGHVCWIQHTAQPDAPWARFGEFAAGWGRRLDEVLRPGEAGHALYPELECAAGDEYVRKTRFSAFIQGSSDLHERLAARGVDTVIVTGTVTNVCCESTARDAMMLDYKVHFVADANAARTDEEHNTTLANMLIWFADVRSTQELMTLIEAAPVSHVVSGRGA